MRTLTLEIYPSDCVGDSSGKHNFNAASLDANLCNLISRYSDYASAFSDFQSNLSNIIAFTDRYKDPSRFNLAVSTTNVLSSYWEKHEFSVHYPLNITPTGDLSCPTINQDDNTLRSLALAYLINNFPAQNYINGTLANVVFFLYSTPVDPNNLSALQKVTSSPEFSYMVRNMNVSVIRQDIHFANGKVFQFENNGDNLWVYTKTFQGDALTNVNNFVVPRTPPVTRVLTPRSPVEGRTAINLTIDTNLFNYDVYGEAINTGLYVAGYTDIFLTINKDVTVGSIDYRYPALTVPSAILSKSKVGFIDGDTVSIVNNGNILGAGGTGGKGQSWGETVSPANDGLPGGDAILLQFATSLENMGVIGGGGGGGAGGYIGFSNQNIFDPTRVISELYAGGGGGGGAGAVEGGGGLGGKGFSDTAKVIASTGGDILRQDLNILQTGQLDGKNGNIASDKNGGLGGASVSSGANGATGGGIGINGASTGPTTTIGGITIQYSPKGGIAGKYINGISFADFMDNGKVYGNVS